jgi:quinol monooxygenase YgiN
MHLGRRTFVATVAAGTVALAVPGNASPTGERGMYGLIGKMRAVTGQRDALIAILLEGVSGMPGCLSYVVAQDPADADAIWVTEVWDSQDSHKASLSLPSVKDAISRGKPLIAGFDQHIETAPVGGHGIQVAA